MTDRISALVDKEMTVDERKAILKFILGAVDLTSLEGTDTTDKIKGLCDKALNNEALAAAVCTYATFSGAVSRWLKGTGVKTAAVAGGFPGGQVPAALKVNEVRYALDQGAEEIDFVINRGLLFEGKFDEVYEEINMAAGLCKDIHLKVILETGELGSDENIRKASEIAIMAGADFIKTSTGKSQPAATLEATLVMLDAIGDHHRRTKEKVGIKAAGGIADADTAIKYYLLVEGTLGKEWIDKSFFRIGASRLFDHILNELSGS